MARGKYMARGYEATRGRPKLREDIEKMTDAERRKRLEETTADNLRRLKRGKPARSMGAYTAARLVRESQPIERQIRYHQGRVAKLRLKAKDKKIHKKARDTYRQAANEHLKRIAVLRKKGSK